MVGTVIGYSKSFRQKTENLYDRARRKLASSFRGGDRRRRSSSKQIEQYVIGEDFVATSSNANGNAMHDSDQQLSVTAGQRVEVLDRLPDNPEQFVLVAIVEEESGLPAQRRGLVPVRILQPANEAPHQTAPSAMSTFHRLKQFPLPNHGHR
ncbi:Variant SH3 domain containing protein [Ditylenchus destructor]|uniref:Variant SH3 domain containing protein n=1 Tax=Ditylenchus destructor TaxID=166010 RepID=A0AAD4NIB0_9BILA|nr:Variant SH3 domain containing protein [Ditylenchus destructor]